MAVTSPLNRTDTYGTGAVSVFQFPYYFLQNADLQVWLTDYTTVAAGVPTLLVYGTDYTVAGAGNVLGGSITLLGAPTSLVLPVPPTSTQEISIIRSPALTQELILPGSGPLNTASIVTEFDNLEMQIQALAAKYGDNPFPSASLAAQIAAIQLAQTGVTATFMGYIAGTTLTVTTMLTGALVPGQTLAATSLVANTNIQTLGTSTGGVGTVVVNNSQTLGSLGSPVAFTASGTGFVTSAGVLGALASTIVGMGDALLGVLQPWAGAVPTTQHQINSETVSVFRFLTAAQIQDVVTGGLTLDLTVPINAAIQACAAAGAALYYPWGEYLITAGLVIPTNTNGFRMFGCGRGSKIICNTGSNNNGVNMLFGLTCSNVIVDGLAFTNSGYGNTFPTIGTYTGMGCGVTFVNSTACTVTNCFFNNCGSLGQGVSSIYFSSCHECLAIGNRITGGMNGINTDNWYYSTNSSALSQHNQIIGNYCTGCQGFPIVTDISAAYNVAEVGDVIVGNVLFSNIYGIMVLGKFCVVADNKIDGNGANSSAYFGYDGIVISGESNIVTHNIITNPWRSGIILLANSGTSGGILGTSRSNTAVDDYPQCTLCINNRVEGNHIEFQSSIVAAGDPLGYSYGIRACNGTTTSSNFTGNQIKNNTIINARHQAIWAGEANNLDELWIEGNRIFNPAQDGIKAVNAQIGCHVLNNDISNANGSGNGINIQSCKGVTVSGNKVRLSNQNGIFVYACPFALVFGNRCLDNGQSSSTLYSGIVLTAGCSSSSVYGNFSGNTTAPGQKWGVYINETYTNISVFGNTYLNNSVSEALPASGASVSFGALAAGGGGILIYANAMPTNGSWTIGDTVINTAPTNAAGVAFGWRRVTTGSGNVLNTDWRAFGVTV